MSSLPEPDTTIEMAVVFSQAMIDIAHEVGATLMTDHMQAVEQALAAGQRRYALAVLRTLPCRLSGRGHPCEKHYEDRDVWCDVHRAIGELEAAAVLDAAL